jgi:hypothetical protein
MILLINEAIQVIYNITLRIKERWNEKIIYLIFVYRSGGVSGRGPAKSNMGYPASHGKQP